MIENSTVLVLGAGASMPYGFPSGAQLRRQLCTPNALQGLVQNGLFSQGTIAEFCAVFHRSGVQSIDAFLAKRGGHEIGNYGVTFADVGKAAIAYVLISCENLKQLLSFENSDHWYEYLWGIIGRTLDGFESSKLTIVTFNYDRSLECYLVTALKNAFGLDDERSLQISKALKVIHVYGQLGYLPNDSDRRENERAYTPEISSASIRVAAEGIRVIPESRDDDQVFVEVQELFMSADRICFLGFGFDDTNVRRLGLQEILTKRASSGQFHRPRVYSTTVGMMDAERHTVKTILSPDPKQFGYSTNQRTLCEQAKETTARSVDSYKTDLTKSYLRQTGALLNGIQP